jgi:hypothetical protein
MTQLPEDVTVLNITPHCAKDSLKNFTQRDDACEATVYMIADLPQKVNTLSWPITQVTLGYTPG